MTSIHEAAAIDALRSAGLMVDAIAWDSSLHRCGTVEKPRSKNGCYLAHADSPASIWWQDWRSGESGTWTAKEQDKMTKAEREALKLRINSAKKERETEQARVNAEAATRAKRIYDKAAACKGHPYLSMKGVKTVGGLRVSGKALVVPVRDGSGKLVSLQFINAAGNKRFLAGGRKKGCFFFVGDKDRDKPLLICEGLSTALSLYECVDSPVLVSFDAGNLLPVAEMARGKYPDWKIVVCADFDEPSEKYPVSGGIGLHAATKATQAVSGLLAIPHLKNCIKCDWNDLHQKEGCDAVFQQFSRAGKPEPPKDKLPDGFVMRTTGNRQGLYHIECKEDAEPVETWLAAPFEILGETRNAESNAWGLYLRWLDSDGKSHTWAMARALLAGRDSSEWRVALVDGGLRIATSQRARGLLVNFFDTYKTDTRVLCVERTGWHCGGAAYVLPNKTFFDATTQNSVGKVGKVGKCVSILELELSDQIKCQSERSENVVLQRASRDNPFTVGGNFEGWRNTIGTWAQGNTRLMLALCASFAGALLEPASMESGGINFIGGSSTGKTTALVIGGSVWGKGSSSSGFVKNWRSTANGLEGLAEVHSDSCLCLDEIGQIEGRSLEAAAYMLANGSGKVRATADGNTKAVKTWRIMFLSSGEVGLAAKINEAGGKVKAGQSVRLVDVPSDAGAGFGLFENLHGHETAQGFSDALKHAAATNYGHAARTFIQGFIDNREMETANLHEWMETGLDKLCPADADGQVKRVACRFLLCAAAGEMAAEWKILPWEQGEAFAAVKVCFDAWLESRGGTGAAEDADIIRQVMLFLEQHGASSFQEFGKSDVPYKRAGFRETDDITGKVLFYILPEVFRVEVCRGLDYKRAGELLKNKGLLLPADGKNLQRKLPAGATGFVGKRAYVLTLEGCHEVV